MRSVRRLDVAGKRYVAERLGLDLIDVTYSGATTAHVLRDTQNGVPPHIDELDGAEALVTVTIGGNDVGYRPHHP